MLAACLGGFVAGTLHVLAGPDHLAALAPLALQARRRAWKVGLRWGLGHSAGILAVAVLAFGFRQTAALDRLAGWGERLVGATLILLGLWGFRNLFRRHLHAHVHEHEGRAHLHVHVHSVGEDHRTPGAHVHGHAAFWVGTLHGLAGTAHLLGILPSLTLPAWTETAGYLTAFAAGTVGAMVLFAGLVGGLAPGKTERGLRLYRGGLAAASALCALVGVAWLLLPLFGIELP
jgi:hypothetical protein